MKRRYHLGLPFWVYCGLTLLVAVAAMNRGDNLLLGVFAMMASALLTSGIVSGAMMVSLRVRRVVPGHGEVGRALVVRYATRNRSRLWPAFNILFHERLAEAPAPWQDLLEPAPAWVLHVGPRETVHGEAAFTPTRRGVVTFKAVRVSTTFPFGIIRKSVTFTQAQRTLVFPQVFSLRRRVLDAVLPDDGIGMRASPRAGVGDDYYGLREFRPGDSMRSVAWKQTANRDQLVCIERARSDPPRIRVVLNLAVNGDATDDGREREEDAIALAASIVHAAEVSGCEIGLTVLGVTSPHVPVRAGHWHRNRIMAVLAELDLDAPRPRASKVHFAGRRRQALIVVHPDRIEPDVVRQHAWHFTARRIDELVDRTRPAPGSSPGNSPGSGPPSPSDSLPGAGAEVAA